MNHALQISTCWWYMQKNQINRECSQLCDNVFLSNAPPSSFELRRKAHHLIAWTMHSAKDEITEEASLCRARHKLAADWGKMPTRLAWAQICSYAGGLILMQISHTECVQTSLSRQSTRWIILLLVVSTLFWLCNKESYGINSCENEQSNFVMFFK